MDDKMVSGHRKKMKKKYQSHSFGFLLWFEVLLETYFKSLGPGSGFSFRRADRTEPNQSKESLSYFLTNGEIQRLDIQGFLRSRNARRRFVCVCVWNDSHIEEPEEVEMR
mmetsp:Transcript_22743/g.25656  ORF Transcript_22743/g.25656 Transcript_22743/m.25656 type:complete len:110 (+) Transcript_22743:1303-1632(+)